MGMRLLSKFSSIWLSALVSMQFACFFSLEENADARSHRRHVTQSAPATSHHGGRHRGSTHTASVGGRHHGRHHVAVGGRRHGHVVAHAAPKPRYAYPLGIFMMHAPTFEVTPFAEDVSSSISRAFEQGRADDVPARSLARAGVVNVHHLRGGIFWRREPVKFIIVHSTETGNPNMGAVRVIESWNSSGRRHPGAQYVVDRDGTIYQAVDPDLATVHVNIFKTLPGINNDNSVGIEMCHTGHQNYPSEQVQSVIRLVSYLQDRYKVQDDNVITHRYAQQGDHTDPVNFDWNQFLLDKDHFRSKAIAMKVNKIRDDSRSWASVDTPQNPSATTILQVHQPMQSQASSNKPVETRLAPAVHTAPRLELRGPIELDPASIEQLNPPVPPKQAIPPAVVQPAATLHPVSPAPTLYPATQLDGARTATPPASPSTVSPPPAPAQAPPLAPTSVAPVPQSVKTPPTGINDLTAPKETAPSLPPKAPPAGQSTSGTTQSPTPAPPVPATSPAPAPTQPQPAPAKSSEKESVRFFMR